MSSILVTGGAGYIGSHVVNYLLDQGQEVVVLDDLSGGFCDALPRDSLIQGNIGDRSILDELFFQHRIEAVMNFASFIEVGASVKSPAAYYCNNVGNTLNLLDAMVRHDVRKFVFSSTAAIFGEPEYTPIDELHRKAPINPYGRSKWLIEQVLPDFDQAYGLKSVCLRYFNAAGADPAGQLGERHEPETHLIPLVLQAASGRRDKITIFGNDYDTEDGTCIRDYIHVEDLAQAHWLALKHIDTKRQSAAFNLGNGTGYSIREVIDTVREVSGRDFLVEEGVRREGDPPILIADSRKARSSLGWQPKFSDLTDIVQHAWNWELRKGEVW